MAGNGTLAALPVGISSKFLFLSWGRIWKINLTQDHPSPEVDFQIRPQLTRERPTYPRAINYREHDPPHFHAWYAGADISVRISDGSVSGQMQRRALALVLEWWHLHRTELLDDWNLAQAGATLKKIDPLD